jgi:cysteine desulfurase family protein (TIGR01976 family)
MTAYDVESVRAHFPALAEGAAHFDGPGGSQTPDVVADAVAGALRSAVANRGLITVAERRADEIVLTARQAMADLLGSAPDGIIFGRSMTALTYDLSRALAKLWAPGDEIIVSSLDHDANIRPWVQAAASRDVVVRWAEFDPVTGVLAVDTVTGLLSSRTRLVAVTGASNLLGTRPDVAAIAEAVHAAGALLYVDGVHLTAHAFVDVEELGADFYACSPYKFLGPHLGVLSASPTLLESLHPDKLDSMPARVPERFEQGTLPYELLAGVTAAVDFLASLVRCKGSRRERLAVSLAAMEEHESAMRLRLEDGLTSVPSVTLYGSPERHRAPTVLFSVDGRASAEVFQMLSKSGVNAPAGSFYALECSRRLGLGTEGAVRAGMAPYTCSDDVDRLVAGVSGLVPKQSANVVA